MSQARKLAALKQAEEKKFLSSKMEGQKGKVKLEGDVLEELLKPEEEEDDGDYVTTEDLALLHRTYEAKLLLQQEAAEKAALERQKALESKIEDLMKLLATSMLAKESATSTSTPPTPRVEAPSTSEEDPGTSSTLATFGNREVLKALMAQIPEYSGSGGVPRLLEFIDKFEAVREETNLSPSLELQFAASKLSGDALIWWRQHKREFSSSSSERIKTFEELQRGLKEQFAPPEYATTIRTKLRSLKQTGTVRDYNAVFSRLVQQLPAVSFEEVSFDYLQGLREEVRNLVRTQYGLKTLRELQQAALRMDPNQHQEDSRAKRSEGTAFSVKRKKAPKKGPKKTPWKKWGCWYCGEEEHNSKNCPKLRLILNAHETGAKRTEEQAMVARSSIYLDSAASSHMTNQSDWLEDFEELEGASVKVGNGMELAIIGKGSLPLTIETEKGTVDYEVANVLCVPELSDTLLSIGEIAREGHKAIFDEDGAQIQLDGGESFEVKHSNGMYALNAKPRTIDERALVAKNNALDKANLWHYRLGHPGRNATLRLGFDVLEAKCKACEMAKSHKQPYNKPASRAQEALHRVYSDLIGPLSPEAQGTFQGAKYVLTFVDDYSRFAFVYFLTKKDEVFETFKRFKAFIEKKLGCKIRILHTDRGGEYLSFIMETYLEEEGIVHEKTAPYSPQSNGVAEHFNRTLLESERALSFTANIPSTLWADLAATAAHVRNRLPHCSNEWRSPYELLYGEKPSMEHLRVVWCDAYVHINKARRKGKLGPWAQKLKLLGYEEDYAYRLWDPEKKKIVVSRDVVFDESNILKSDYTPPTDGEDTDWEVDAIVDESLIDGVPYYKVKWTGYSDDESTWEPLEHVEHLDAFAEWIHRKTEKAMIASATPTKIEPTTYAEAIASEDAERWIEAMASEVDSLAKNQTWEIVKEAPRGRKALGSKWVFKLKRNADGSIARYKARLVVKGYEQREGIDYDETFAPVVKFTTIRLIMTIAAIEDMDIDQMDVVTAFLNGELLENEAVYMKVPDGIGLRVGTIVRLRRTLYGLKQSPRKWNDKLNKHLLKMGFSRSANDPALYWKADDKGITFILVYVDDILIFSPKGSNSTPIKQALSKEFEMKDMGELKSFLGMEVHRDRKKRTITLSQKGYIDAILEWFGFNDASPVWTPMVSQKMGGLTKKGNEPNPREDDYRSIVGSLMYLMIGTRPDIASSMGIVSRYLSNPSEEHLTAVKRILCYVKGTKEYGLTLGPSDANNSFNLYGYADADWANDVDTRKSTSGYTFYAGSGAISWCSKRQPTITLSTAEAEYIALCASVQEALWLRSLLEEVQYPLFLSSKKPTTILEDNQSCIALAANPVHHARTKHIDIKYHFIRDYIDKGDIDVVYCPTKEMVTDVLTKPLARPAFEVHVKALGVGPRDEWNDAP